MMEKFLSASDAVSLVMDKGLKKFYIELQEAADVARQSKQSSSASFMSSILIYCWAEAKFCCTEICLRLGALQIVGSLVLT